MKKLFFTLVALCATMSMEAQTIEIYKNDVKVASYSNKATATYKAIMKQTPAPVTTDKATRSDGIEIAWVQLWEDGPKWATCNVGAENDQPEDYGGYYCWGSTINMDTDESRFYRNGIGPLSGDDDTATALWGENWRMPTNDELKALVNPENCTCTWTTQKGVNGLLCTGKGDYSSNSIFLTAAGWFSGGISNLGTSGLYWSSTPSGSDKACNRYFDFNSQGFVEYFRSEGHSVRAVLKEE